MSECLNDMNICKKCQHRENRSLFSQVRCKQTGRGYEYSDIDEACSLPQNCPYQNQHRSAWNETIIKHFYRNHLFSIIPNFFMVFFAIGIGIYIMSFVLWGFMELLHWSNAYLETVAIESIYVSGIASFLLSLLLCAHPTSEAFATKRRMNERLYAWTHSLKNTPEGLLGIYDKQVVEYVESA